MELAVFTSEQLAERDRAFIDRAVNEAVTRVLGMVETQSLAGYVTQEAVMALLDIKSPETMRRKRDDGLRGCKVGNQWLYRVEDLQAYLSREDG